MEKVTISDKKKREFKLWCNALLDRADMSKKELAKLIDAPLPRVSEAINGKGECKKYIPMIIRALGSEEDIERFSELCK